MKNELNIDFRATTTSRRIRQRRAKKTLRYPLFQRGLGGFSSNFHILDRGYCGHEHLLEHGIINMNGRIYDPIVGQFMQADNYIQTPEDYIGYNRYAYCRYNPFKFTDPSGEMLSGRYHTEGSASMITDPKEPNKVGTEADHAAWMAWIEKCDRIMAFYEAVRKILTAGSGGGGGSGSGTAPANGAGTGGISQGVKQTGSGIYIGTDPKVQKRIADAISEIIGDEITYDEATGKITGREGSGMGVGTGELDILQGFFDGLIQNADRNGKRIDMGFADESSSIKAVQGHSSGNIHFSKWFYDHESSPAYDYPTTDSKNSYREVSTFGQIIAHELFGHGLDWVNNYTSPFKDWRSDWEERAVERENYYAFLIGKPIRCFQ